VQRRPRSAADSLAQSVRDGRYDWDGRSLQLDISEPERGNAMHGLTRWRNWRIAERGRARVVMEQVLYPTPGYPFALEAQITYELLDDGLVVTTRARNIGRDAAPYGVGFHPYLQRPDASLIDDAILTVPAAVELVADERLIPQKAQSLTGGARDFATPRAIGEVVSIPASPTSRATAMGAHGASSPSLTAARAPSSGSMTAIPSSWSTRPTRCRHHSADAASRSSR
jgi:galactose mutarotase-like enzyme